MTLTPGELRRTHDVLYIRSKLYTRLASSGVVTSIAKHDVFVVLEYMPEPDLEYDTGQRQYKIVTRRGVFIAFDKHVLERSSVVADGNHS